MQFCPMLPRRLYEPLLIGHDGESSPAKAFRESCWRSVRRVRFNFSDWWADSTTESYLDSTLSRRRFWHITLAAIGVISVVTDWYDGAIAFVCIDVVFLIGVVLVTNLMPRQHLKADFVLSSITALCALCGLLAIRCGHRYTQGVDASGSQEMWVWNIVGVFLFVMYMGMHSTVTAAALFMLMLLSTIIAPSASFAFAAGACFAATVGCMLESVLAAAHKYHVALKTVLGGCSDGVVCVSVSAGIVSSASGRLRDIWLGGMSSGASGVDFKGCLHPDDAGQWEALLKEARTRVPEARLVTCQTVLLDSVMTMDCKLVPYMRRQDELWICCHIVGEVRTASSPGAPAFGAGQGLPARVKDEAVQDPSSVVGRGDQAAPGAPVPQQASHPAPQVGIGSPSVGAGTELTYSISEISGPSPKVKLDASTQTLSSFPQDCARPPRLPREPAQPAAAGAAPSSAGARPQGRQVHARGPKRRVLPHYAETPASTQTFILQEACNAINARGRGCCAWHITTGRLQAALGKMRDRACDGGFLPFGDWQCARCLALNTFPEDEEEEDECAICGTVEEHTRTDSGEFGGSEGAHRVPEPDHPAQPSPVRDEQ